MVVLLYTCVCVWHKTQIVPPRLLYHRARIASYPTPTPSLLWAFFRSAAPILLWNDAKSFRTFWHVLATRGYRRAIRAAVASQHMTSWANSRPESSDTSRKPKRQSFVNGTCSRLENSAASNLNGYPCPGLRQWLCWGISRIPHSTSCPTLFAISYIRYRR